MRPEGPPTRTLTAIPPGSLAPTRLGDVAGVLDRFGRYRVVRELGRGGMGTVFEGVDDATGERVALKTLRAASDADLTQLKAEFRAAAWLAHPNVVPLYELSVDAGRAWFTMELVEGDGLLDAVGRSADRAALLRALLRQAAEGLHALHREGLVHRDVKPANLVVRSDGRLVILDFGIARRWLVDPEGGSVAGSPGYLAPEVIAGANPTPAADWYALGVTLCVAWTGRHPEVERPLLPGAPPDLVDACRGLLEPVAAKRAGWSEMCAWFGAAELPRSGRESGVWVGRTSELAALHAAWAVVVGGQSSVVVIRGPAGIGKTALMREAARQLDAPTLDARCFERESIPLRALDDTFEALRRWLVLEEHRLEADDHLAMEALAVLHPSMVPGGTPSAGGSDPTELRRRAVSAFALLLGRRSGGQPIVLTFDDVQWGDADSGRIVATLLALPGAPRVLVLATCADHDRPAPFVEEVTRRVPHAVTDVRLSALTLDEARRLAVDLAAAHLDGPATPDWLEALVDASEGVPYFLTALASGAGSGAGSVGAFVAAQVGALTPAERSILEVVALAGRPVPAEVVLRVVGAGEAPVGWVSRLGNLRLLRAEGLRGHDRLECWHGALRTVIERTTDPARRRVVHRALAAAYEAVAGPPELLATHFREGGEPQRAATLARLGAAQARAQLAFHRAAELWGIAAECTADREERRRDLQEQARAWVQAGHLAEAGRTLLRLAADAAPAESVALRAEAGAYLLDAGEVDEGCRQLVPRLSQAGLRLPRSTAAAAAGCLAALLGVGVHASLRAPGHLNERRRLQAEVCWSAARGLLATDAIRGLYFALRGFSFALRSGAPELAGRLQAVVGSVVLMPLGGPLGAWGRHLLDQVEAQAVASGSEVLRGVVQVGRCQQRLLAGDWQGALLAAVAAQALLSEVDGDVGWERDVARMGAMRAEEELGRIVEAARQGWEHRRSGQERGVLYAEVTGLLYEGANLVALGRPAQALQIAAQIRQLWAFDGYHLQHAYALRIEVNCALYVGDVAQARARLEAEWDALAGSQLMQIPMIRFDAWEMRARVALATQGNHAQARGAVRALRRRGTPYAVAWAEALDAVVSGGGAEGVASRLTAAARRLDTLRMRARAACVWWTAGTLRADRTAVDAAEDMLRACGVAEPARWAQVQVPIAGLVQAPR